jgi:plastocyanin
MRIGLGFQGRMRASQRPSPAAAILLPALVLIAAAGCGGQSAEQRSAGQGSKATRAAAEGGAKGAKGAKSGETVAAGHEAAPAGRTNRVVLTDRGCVQFDPHWSTVHPGQSLTWRNDLRTNVTIHVSPGAFDRTEYLVRPGATVSSGPARGTGPFTIWTEPAACQGVPRGVQGSGPGVTVEGGSRP